VAPHEQDGERTRAQHSVDRAQQRLAGFGVESETHVWPGEPADALMQIADEHAAQMIIVGNRGMTGARRVLGSVPNRVSHHARCDVLIVATA
jgi:nucleotide-binding universal stress UspA family protein